MKAQQPAISDRIDIINDEFIEADILSHPENYGPYAILAETLHPMNIYMHVQSIREDWDTHYYSILNLMKDGIESDVVQKSFIKVHFDDNQEIDLAIVDYFINLILWNMLIKTNTAILPKHILFVDELKGDTIKKYIDKYLIDENRKLYSNKELNNVIDDTIYHFHDIDGFAFFLSNTVNLEDNVLLMNASKEFNDCMHADLRNVPIEDVKSVGMQYANKAMEIMKNSKKYLGYDHCLADAWRASEGINPKQFKEFTINIGTKPDGRGGIFPVPIYNSFINGGVANPIDYFIESSTGRTAQIIKYKNTGSSGHFARLLGLNNMDSYLHHDPNYDCCSTNFLKITINDEKTLKMLNNRYYRLDPHGVEYLLKSSDKHLIGKMIYLRSPITCASNARGQGICYKCYGDLAYTIYDSQIHFGVNIGRIASELLSSGLTQMLLSAKHLLETFADKVTWNKEFDDFFEIEGNMIRLSDDIDTKDIKFILDPENIQLVNEEDDDLSYDDDEDGASIYNEYITSFELLCGAQPVPMYNDKDTKLYISSELNTIIRKKGEPFDGKIMIDLDDLKDITLFIISIENNELSQTLEHLQDLLNKNSTIKGMDIHQLSQAVIDTVITGGLKVSAVHLETILSNQVRDANEILERPKWFLTNPDYEILSLDKALRCNPSVTISMSYQKVGKLLYNPLTYKKKGTSFMDLFFMEKPQYAIQGIDPPEKEEFKPKPGEFFEPMVFFENPDNVTAPIDETSEDDSGED